MAQTSSYRNDSGARRKYTPGAGKRTPRDRTRRERSQNFLADRTAVRRILAAAAPMTGPVLEPGAGAGALTGALAATGARVVGYEIDPRYASGLRSRLRNARNVEIVTGDFLQARPPREPFVVVGNIPYSATARIVSWCLHAPGLDAATLVTQLEYARKRTGDYGRWSRLTVAEWPWFTWSLAGRIGRGSFRPVPSVDSAILRIERRPRPLVGDAAGYRRLVELGFRGTGGTLYASLRPHYRDASRAFDRAGIRRDTVVAYVHPDRWITLYHELAGVERGRS